MSVTIEQIEAEHKKLAEMIATLKASQPSLLLLPESSIELRPGEHYAGILLGDDSQPHQHIVLLPGEIEEADFQKAKEFAAQAGGELPTRREQSLLFANLKQHFQAAWYWSGEEHSASRAWGQYFLHGNQYYGNKSYEARARAVRRFPL